MTSKLYKIRLLLFRYKLEMTYNTKNNTVTRTLLHFHEEINWRKIQHHKKQENIYIYTNYIFMKKNNEKSITNKKNTPMSRDSSDSSKLHFHKKRKKNPSHNNIKIQHPICINNHSQFWRHLRILKKKNFFKEIFSNSIFFSSEIHFYSTKLRKRKILMTKKTRTKTMKIFPVVKKINPWVMILLSVSEYRIFFNFIFNFPFL